jgi:hypothetical protein
VSERPSPRASAGVTPELAEAPVVARLMGRMLAEGEGAHLLVLDARREVVEANPTMRALLDGEGRLRLTEASHAALEREAGALAAQASGEPLTPPSPPPFLLQVLGPGDEPVSLVCWLAREGERLVLVGEPPWGEHRRLERLMAEVNDELSALHREVERQRDELERTHWHLRKVSQVLPICLGCRKVRDGVTWEEASRFLDKHARFLSHGYCERCGAKAEAELVDEGER